jgi:phosphoribosylanthranilate isomerase
MWVKICGITRLQDAIAAESLGASAIGFVFTASPRRIAVHEAAKIAGAVHIAKVGVFVNASLERVKEVKSRCLLDIVQLHGDEPPEFCDAVGGKVIKAFRVRDESSLPHIRRYDGIWKVLLDAYVAGVAGGTGRRIPDDLLRSVKDFSGIILAGGISADNVQEYAGYRPFGLDISSGVEGDPGVKDLIKMQKLFININRFL